MDVSYNRKIEKKKENLFQKETLFRWIFPQSGIGTETVKDTLTNETMNWDAW